MDRAWLGPVASGGSPYGIIHIPRRKVGNSTGHRRPVRHVQRRQDMPLGVRRKTECSVIVRRAVAICIQISQTIDNADYLDDAQPSGSGFHKPSPRSKDPVGTEAAYGQVNKILIVGDDGLAKVSRGSRRRRLPRRHCIRANRCNQMWGQITRHRLWPIRTLCVFGETHIECGQCLLRAVWHGHERPSAHREEQGSPPCTAAVGNRAAAGHLY